MAPLVKRLVAFGLPLVILLLPTAWLPIPGLTVVEQRVIALFVFAALSWILEAMPVYATSVCVVVLELLLVSDNVLEILKAAPPGTELGTLIPFREIMATFASPIILLFLGGFFLAMAATKYQLDLNLARVMLKPFGTRPSLVLLGLMVISGVFSMFMSNTATTAMMLAILAPVLSVFKDDDPGKAAFALSIPLAANIGGLGSPVGSPPNGIALKYLVAENAIGFGQWMAFGVPFVLLMLLITWFVLLRFFPIQTPRIELTIKGRFLKHGRAYLVYATFAGTILLWLTSDLHGINPYIIGMLPVGIFSAFQIITKQDLKDISWEVLWLVSGGIALGLAIEKSGLAERVVTSIPFDQYPPLVVLGAATALALLMANIMSHTATANLLLPLMAALGASLPALEPLGGVKLLVLAVTFTVSMGMSLPISTPPNALAHGTGLIRVPDMAKVGVVVGLIGLLAIYAMLYLLNLTGVL